MFVLHSLVKEHPPSTFGPISCVGSKFTLMNAYVRACGESFAWLMEYTHGAQSQVPCISEVRNFVLNFNDYYKAALCRWM